MFLGANLCSTWDKKNGGHLCSIATWSLKSERDYAASQAPKRDGYLYHTVYQYDASGKTVYAISVHMTNEINVAKG